MTIEEASKKIVKQVWVYDIIQNKIVRTEVFAYEPPLELPLELRPSEEKLTYESPALGFAGKLGAQFFDTWQECKEASMVFLQNNIEYHTRMVRLRTDWLNELSGINTANPPSDELFAREEEVAA